MVCDVITLIPHPKDIDNGHFGVDPFIWYKAVEQLDMQRMDGSDNSVTATTAVVVFLMTSISRNTQRLEQPQIVSCLVIVVEIKCPFPLQSKTMNELEWLVVDDDKVFRLNRSHKYFYQEQMQLFVSKRLYCDFVVWSPELKSVERIMPDRVWWDEKSRQVM